MAWKEKNIHRLQYSDVPEALRAESIAKTPPLRTAYNQTCPDRHRDYAMHNPGVCMGAGKILCARSDRCFVPLQDSDGRLRQVGHIGLYHRNCGVNFNQMRQVTYAGWREEKVVGLTFYSSMVSAGHCVRLLDKGRVLLAWTPLTFRSFASGGFSTCFRRQLFRWVPYGLLRLCIKEIRHLSCIRDEIPK